MPPSWIPSLYRTHDAQSPPPDRNKIVGMMQAVDNCTQRLQTHPYDTEIWLERATCFLAVNFPELAASDAYKAILLLDDRAKVSEQVNDASMRAKIHDSLGQALYDCHCHFELAELWDHVSMRYPSEHAHAKASRITRLLATKTEAASSLGGTLQEQKDRVRDGGIVTVNYPWTDERHLGRSRELIDSINEELSNGKEPRTCRLAQSTLSTESDILGMFAARDIVSGERILVDRTATGACSNFNPSSCNNCFVRIQSSAIHPPCCSVPYCSRECRALATRTYHTPLCGQDFTWLQAPARGMPHNASPLRPLLMLRLLATCVQAGPKKHPLDHPLIARLQPLANRSHVDVFTFTESITTPIKILRQLRIDVFANLNFDTMVLHTIWTRLANNKAGSRDLLRGYVDELTPHLPLFNHSCEPNVAWRRRDGSTTIEFYAKRGIEKDEELFCAYVDVRGMGLEERTEALRPWFEGKCECRKCERERVSGAWE